MKKLLFVLAVWAAPLALVAQEMERKCGSMEALARITQADSRIRTNMAEIEAHTSRTIQDQAAQRIEATTITIPVVVHILYNTAAQNISDAQILSQIDVLNEDFGKRNADITKVPAQFSALAANTGITFCLAKTDPNGNPTTGIIRKSTTATSFTYDDKVKYSTSGGSSAWPAGKYLNIWVCNLSGILGYAQFPGGPAASDGVVVLYSALGRTGTLMTGYNKGRTATHEVGHWLNLRHIWGDASCGNDLVTDTPTQAAENYGCPTYPKPSCGNTSDMFMNYMDYVNDACMYMFSNGQSSRMNALFASGGWRSSFTLSSVCNAPVVTPSVCAVPATRSTGAITSSGATLTWSAVSGAASYTVQYRKAGTLTWTIKASTGTSVLLSGLAGSTLYEWQVKTSCTNALSSAYSSSVTFTTAAATSTCSVPSARTTSSISSSSATLSWSGVSGATSYSIQYRKTGTTAWLAKSATTPSTSLTGLNSASSYEWQVKTICGTATSSGYSPSTVFSTLAATVTPTVYCASKGSSTTSEWIAYFGLGVIANTSGGLNSSGYESFTGLSASLKRGYSYVTTFRTGFSATPRTVYYRIWIDYNRDGDFGDAGEQVTGTQSSAATNLAITITVPTTASIGSTRLRIAMKYGGYPLNCETFSNGQVEDYTVNITTAREMAPTETSVTIFPNPAREFAFVNMSLQDEQNHLQFYLRDLQGRVIWQDETTSGARLENFRIPVSGLPDGLYLLQIQAGDEAIVRKLKVSNTSGT